MSKKTQYFKIRPEKLIKEYYLLESEIKQNPTKGISVESIGKSYLGQDLYCYEINLPRSLWLQAVESIRKSAQKSSTKKKRKSPPKKPGSKKKRTTSIATDRKQTKYQKKVCKAPLQSKSPAHKEYKVLLHGAIHAREGMSGALLLILVRSIYIYLLKRKEKIIRGIEYFIYNKVIYNYKNRIYKTQGTPSFSTDRISLHYRYSSIQPFKREYLRACIIPLVNPDGVYLCTNRRQMWKIFSKNTRFTNFLHLCGKYNIFGKSTQNGYNLGNFTHENIRYLKYFKNNEDFKLFKANLNFVDLNVNFPTGFGKGKSNRFTESSSSFVGYFPLSQSENISLTKKTEAFRPDISFSFHNLGNVVYYGYGNSFSSSALTPLVSSTLGFVPFTTPTSFGGYKEWFIHTFNNPSFTVEFGMEPDICQQDSDTYLDIFNETPIYLPKVLSMLSSVSDTGFAGDPVD